MNDVDALNLALLLLRVWIGTVMLAHGIRHIFGGGKIKGTGGWFESLGMKPGIVHAWLASLTEIGAGAGLVLGLFTPLCAAGVIGTMFVAFVTNHFKNGFFIFRKGEGYEYVLTLTCAALALGALGAGRVSLDHAIGFDVDGWGGLALTALAGGGGAAAVLVSSWRPERTKAG